MPKLPKRKTSDWAKRVEGRNPNINTKLYQSKYWKAKRESFWRKPENQICANCKKPREDKFVVDHVTPVPLGIDINEFIMFTENNKLQALCSHCNAVKTANDRWGKKLKQ